jgi:hypothetical protein
MKLVPEAHTLSRNPLRDSDVKKKLLGRIVGLLCTGALLGTTAAVAQNQRGDWSLTGADPGQSGWQKDELGLTPESVPANFKFLWKIKLGASSRGPRSFSEPLLAGRLINGQGFKDIAYWASGDTLYAVDSELGDLIWKKQFSAASGSSACGVSSLSYTMEPPVVINFNARRRPPGTPRPPEPPAAAPSGRRLGVAPGGGYFGLKGIYVLTPDGMLHEQVMTTGADFASPVKFLPSGNNGATGLNFTEKTIFTATGRDCGSVPNGVWAIDLSSSDYPVADYSTEKVRPLALTGPVVTPDGTSLIVTGAGSGDVHPGSVVAVAKDMKVKDWYTPEGGMATYRGVSPITFTYKEKQLVITPGKDGGIVLLDAASLGGSDHHTALAEAAPLSKAGETHGWDGFASWQDKDGTAWIYASISAANSMNGKTNAHGAVAAFKVEGSGDKFSLTPVWISEDMVNPAPPRIANGIVVTLAGGDASTHAILRVLNAATGAELFSSKDQISTYTELSGVAVGDSHAFFTDHDNVLYSFGIGLEH